MCLRLSKTDFDILWAVIHLQADKDEGEGILVRDIAATCGYSERTVKGHLVALTDKKVLNREIARGRGRPYRYAVLCKLPQHYPTPYWVSISLSEPI